MSERAQSAAPVMIPTHSRRKPPLQQIKWARRRAGPTPSSPWMKIHTTAWSRLWKATLPIVRKIARSRYVNKKTARIPPSWTARIWRVSILPCQSLWIPHMSLPPPEGG